MNKVVNIKLYGNLLDNAEVLFVSKEKIIFNHEGENYCEWLKDVTYLDKGEELSFQPQDYDVSDLSLCTVDSPAIPSPAKLLLLKSVESFYIFVNPKNDTEIALHSSMVELI